MAGRGIKAKSHEKLDAATINKVIALLDAEEPITKKEACEILNIRYNTTRLQRIIDEHEEVLAYKEKRKSQDRGKGATRDEIKSVIEYYLDGDNISEIATRLYRSNAFVKAIIERVGIPQKLPSNYDRYRDTMLPEQCAKLVPLLLKTVQHRPPDFAARFQSLFPGAVVTTVDGYPESVHGG